MFTNNRKYGFSYFLSSFHTLIVLMFLGWFFPTSDGFKYVGFWALALSLIEILLIIPSSLGNSLLHKIPSYSLKNKKKSFGNLLTLVVWIVVIIAINFFVFDREIIWFVSSREFLGSRASLGDRGSNQILPFLGIVLALSFVKQVFNYLFVAVEKQNVLFKNNLIGVIVGVMIALFVIPRRNLLGGVITQLTIEIFFTFGAIIIAKKLDLMPSLQKKPVRWMGGILIIAGMVGIGINYLLTPYEPDILRFILIALVFNGLIVLASWKPLKTVAKGLTVD